MKRPYKKTSLEWLRQNEAVFRDILGAAGHQHKALRHLETLFSPAGEHMLSFLDIPQRDLENALRVCEKIMLGLGPTAEAMREELDARGE